MTQLCHTCRAVLVPGLAHSCLRSVNDTRGVAANGELLVIDTAAKRATVIPPKPRTPHW